MEGDTFFSGGRVDEDLLAITSVHPMRADAVEALLTRRGATDPSSRGWWTTAS